MMRRACFALLLVSPLLSGCAAVVAGGAVGAAVVAMDAREVGTQVDDNSLRLRVQSQLNEVDELRAQRVLVVAYDSNVLLYGQVASESLKSQAQRVTRDVNGVNRVYNQLRVGEPVTFTQRSRDTLLTSRVKTALVTSSEFDHTNIRVYSEQGEVFLVGRTADNAARHAIEIVRQINGVERVIDVIERR
jgi:osmotically-inducible protein OsmY